MTAQPRTVDGRPRTLGVAERGSAPANVIDEKMTRVITPIGERARGLTEEAAAWTGLRPGIAVAIANVDAHVAVPAATVTETGRMVMIIGTSTCHMVLGSATSCAGTTSTTSSPGASDPAGARSSCAGRVPRRRRPRVPGRAHRRGMIAANDSPAPGGGT